MKLKMSDILKPGTVLKARKLTDKQVKQTIQDIERKQSQVRKNKSIRFRSNI